MDIGLFCCISQIAAANKGPQTVDKLRRAAGSEGGTSMAKSPDTVFMDGIAVRRPRQALFFKRRDQRQLTDIAAPCRSWVADPLEDTPYSNDLRIKSARYKIER